MIVVRSSFSRSSIFKMFSDTKAKSRRFKIPPVRRAFSKSSVFTTDYCGRLTRIRLDTLCLLCNKVCLFRIGCD